MVAFGIAYAFVYRSVATASRQQVGLVEELVELAGGFERLMVIPGSFGRARLELVVVAVILALMVVKPF
jgi:hypothetical protein